MVPVRSQCCAVLSPAQYCPRCHRLGFSLNLSGKLKKACLKMNILDLIQHSKYCIFQHTSSYIVIMDSTSLELIRCQNWKSSFKLVGRKFLRMLQLFLPSLISFNVIFLWKFGDLFYYGIRKDKTAFHKCNNHYWVSVSIGFAFQIRIIWWSTQRHCFSLLSIKAPKSTLINF